MNNIFNFSSTGFNGIYSALLLTFFSAACNKKRSGLSNESGRNLVGLASTISLNPGGDTMNVADVHTRVGYFGGDITGIIEKNENIDGFINFQFNQIVL